MAISVLLSSDQRPPAVTTMTTSSACLKCGTIAKSGESSCCGRGGSWFKNCGGAGNTRLQHTWYEGIHVCKTRTRSRIAAGQRENTARQKDLVSSHGVGKANPKGVLANIIATSVTDATPIMSACSVCYSLLKPPRNHRGRDCLYFSEHVTTSTHHCIVQLPRI